ncbi:MAG: sulfatase-like hydrolase/transferase [Lentisphaerae bacterium]|jgi:arylsulfatase|nr:sulfatase-like hydrolase/transferase [Lentisphaerota bacterium]MBT5613225.1 sulfatase-like hydrolase/transferase [Lentisphaerota bacterium]MBT7062112.1 sulfatase-like hydrolase/transferase [Lentisphaerota bacterium]MBT7847624.1 sulfatase-like hydrolase/transferase [Lentisphaerota bacterium]
MKVPPSVLFILSDQHTAQCMGCAGHPVVQTPNLDRLATDGVWFRNAICQSPICSPSRVSYLSGQYCHNHGYYGNAGPNPGGLPNLLGHFRRSGYVTAAVGKIHCPEYWIEDDADFFREVYDNCSVGRAPEYTAYLKEKGLLELRDDGAYPEMTEPGQLNTDGRASSLPYADSVEGYTVRQSIAFMEDAVENGRPFFVHASLPRPHSSYCPSEPFWSMYDDVDLQLPPSTDYDMSLKAPTMREERAMFERGDWTVFEPRTHEAARLRKLQGYLGCVSQVDHAVGELLDWLEQATVADNTIVVYASDHGDYVCQHGLMEKAPGICSDAITRVPFFWRWPGQIASGYTCEQLVEAVDVSATLCALTGLDQMLTSDGRDLSALLAGGSEPVREIAVTEHAWSKSVRKGKYRLVYYPPQMFTEQYPDGFGELYDLEVDPWEMSNLYFAPESRTVVDELTRDLLAWLITTTRIKTIAPAKRDEDSGWQVMRRHKTAVHADSKISPRGFADLWNRNYL